MYAKIFRQIFESSVADDYRVRLVFQDLLVLADKTGIVEMRQDVIAATTRVPVDIVEHALQKLAEPDPDSRDEQEEGRRIVSLGHNRWQIVSYAAYRDTKDEDERRAYNAERQRRHRAARKSEGVITSHTLSHDVTPCHTPSQNVAHIEAEAEASSEEEEDRQSGLTDSTPSRSIAVDAASDAGGSTPTVPPASTPTPTPPPPARALRRPATAYPLEGVCVNPVEVPTDRQCAASVSPATTPSPSPASPAHRLAVGYLDRYPGRELFSTAARTTWPAIFNRLLARFSEADLTGAIEWVWGGENKFWFDQVVRKNGGDPVVWLESRIAEIVAEWRSSTRRRPTGASAKSKWSGDPTRGGWLHELAPPTGDYDDGHESAYPEGSLGGLLDSL
jgi:hypothetical protein